MPIYVPCGQNASGNDPYISNVISLVHGNGAENGTLFPDNGTLQATWTAGGSAITSTAEQKFGQGSIYIPNSVSYIRNTATITSALQNLNHTLEFWIFPLEWTAAAANALWTMGAGPVMGSYTEVPGGNTIAPLNNQLDYYIGGVKDITTATNPVTLNAWNWIVYEKTNVSIGNIWTIRINGILNYTYFSGNPNPNGDPFTIGCQSNNTGGIMAYFQEIRLTKFPVNSPARYGTTIYVPPPTRAFPNATN